MEWFRWFNGTSIDPKMKLIAKRSKQKLPAVIAVWAMLLERASESEERGKITGFDCETIDVYLGLRDGATRAIMDAMEAKEMIAGDIVCKWSERQVKKEDETATERKRLQREREKLEKEKLALEAKYEALEKKMKELQGVSKEKNSNKQDVTGCHTTSHDVTLDKIRRDKKEIQEECVFAGAREDSSLHDFDGKNIGPRKTDSPSKGHPQWSAFLACWQVYPVQQGQEDAWREWVRLWENHTLAESYAIRDAILLLVAEDTRWKRGKVPKMAKWLAGKGWNDQPYVEPHEIVGSGKRPRPRANTVAQQQAQDNDDMAKMLLQARRAKHAQPEFHASIAGQSCTALPTGG